MQFFCECNASVHYLWLLPCSAALSLDEIGLNCSRLDRVTLAWIWLDCIGYHLSFERLLCRSGVPQFTGHPRNSFITSVKEFKLNSTHSFSRLNIFGSLPCFKWVLFRESFFFHKLITSCSIFWARASRPCETHSSNGDGGTRFSESETYKKMPLHEIYRKMP